MRAALRDIRLPAEAPGGALADLLVSVGLAALAALILVLVLRLLLTQQGARKAETLPEQVARLHALPEGARRVALLRLLRTHAPERYREISKDLYAPGALDQAALEAEVARLV